MSIQGSNKPKVKRRKHSPEFRSRVVKECEESGKSVAQIARQYQLNAKLIHKWRRDLQQSISTCANDFIALSLIPAPVNQPSGDSTIKVELTSGVGSIVQHWPVSEAHQLAHWLRQL